MKRVSIDAINGYYQSIKSGYGAHTRLIVGIVGIIFLLFIAFSISRYNRDFFSISHRAGSVIKVILPGDIPMELVWCPPGTFTMGSADEDNYTNISRMFEGIRRIWDKPNCDEQPHEVSLTEGFWIGRTEVTQAQWGAFTSYNPSFNTRISIVAPSISYSSLFGVPVECARVDAPYIEAPGILGARSGIIFPAKELAPVENVSWLQTIRFTSWLNRVAREDLQTIGQGCVEWEFSLPTEAQWEYACRAGSKTEYPWGDTFVTNKMSCANPESWQPVPLQMTLPKNVASYLPNNWGIYDMNGNVSEWVLDYYSPTFYAESPSKDPFNDKPWNGERVIRGGGHWNHPDACRSAHRESMAPSDFGRNLGFRVVLRRK